MTDTAPTHTVTQVSILSALLARRFDGLMACRELLKHGDFGIGTYDRMDGEMILVDGAFYQGRAGGAMRGTGAINCETKTKLVTFPSSSPPHS